jgi:FkbM family methyltransferase
MPDRAGTSGLEWQRRLLKALSRCRTTNSGGGLLAHLLRWSRRRALLARLDGDWQAGFVLHETGDFVFVPTPLDARGRHCLLNPPRAHKAALAVGPTGRLVAFEPQALIARALDATLRINNLTQASMVEAAVSDRVGAQDFTVPEITSSAVDTGRARLGAAGTGETASTVRSVTLDGFIGEAGLDRLDLVKIDVEGHERAVIEGARVTIARFHPAIVMETGHENAADRAAIAALLRGADYALVGVLLDHGVAPASWESYAAGAAPCLPGEIHNLLILPGAAARPASRDGG